MPTLTPAQWIAMILVILGAITGGTSQLTEVIGPGATKVAVALASLATTILSGWIMVLTGQASQVKAVQAMPGVDKIVVNAQANQTLASLAVDPSQQKIETAPGAAGTVANTAKNG